MLTTSGGSAVFGQAVTLVATMTVPGGGPLAGSITFSDGGAALGTVTLGGSDTATLTTSTLAIAPIDNSGLQRRRRLPRRTIGGDLRVGRTGRHPDGPDVSTGLQEEKGGVGRPHAEVNQHP